MVSKFEENIPIYIQIMNLIKIDIVKGNLKAGEKLPSVREMSSTLQVNPNTLQRAYQELEREGITYTERGTGNFVAADKEMFLKLKKEMSNDVTNSFVMGMKRLGFEDKEIIDSIKEKLEKLTGGN